MQFVREDVGTDSAAVYPDDAISLVSAADPGPALIVISGTGDLLPEPFDGWSPCCEIRYVAGAATKFAAPAPVLTGRKLELHVATSTRALQHDAHSSPIPTRCHALRGGGGHDARSVALNSASNAWPIHCVNAGGIASTTSACVMGQSMPMTSRAFSTGVTWP
jgi:hypothetical protein